MFSSRPHYLPVPYFQAICLHYEKSAQQVCSACWQTLGQPLYQQSQILWANSFQCCLSNSLTSSWVEPMRWGFRHMCPRACDVERSNLHTFLLHFWADISTDILDKSVAHSSSFVASLSSKWIPIQIGPQENYWRTSRCTMGHKKPHN